MGCVKPHNGGHEIFFIHCQHRLTGPNFVFPSLFCAMD